LVLKAAFSQAGIPSYNCRSLILPLVGRITHMLMSTLTLYELHWSLEQGGRAMKLHLGGPDIENLKQRHNIGGLAAALNRKDAHGLQYLLLQGDSATAGGSLNDQGMPR
jgi:hypothetical protein